METIDGICKGNSGARIVDQVVDWQARVKSLEEENILYPLHFKKPETKKEMSSAPADTDDVEEILQDGETETKVRGIHLFFRPDLNGVNSGVYVRYKTSLSDQFWTHRLGLRYLERLTKEVRKEIRKSLRLEVPRIPVVATIQKALSKVDITGPRKCTFSGSTLPPSSTSSSASAMDPTTWWERMVKGWFLRRKNACGTCCDLSTELAMLVASKPKGGSNAQLRTYNQKLAKREAKKKELQEHRDSSDGDCQSANLYKLRTGTSAYKFYRRIFKRAHGQRLGQVSTPAAEGAQWLLRQSIVGAQATQVCVPNVTCS